MIIFNISGWPTNGLFPPHHDMTIMETWGSKTYQNRILEVHPPLLDFVWSCTIVVSRVNMVKPPRNHQALSPASPGLENFLMSDEPSWCSCWAVVIQRALGYENANMETIYGWFIYIDLPSYLLQATGGYALIESLRNDASTHTHTHTNVGPWWSSQVSHGCWGTQRWHEDSWLVVNIYIIYNIYII